MCMLLECKRYIEPMEYGSRFLAHGCVRIKNNQLNETNDHQSFDHQTCQSFWPIGSRFFKQNVYSGRTHFLFFLKDPFHTPSRILNDPGQTRIRIQWKYCCIPVLPCTILRHSSAVQTTRPYLMHSRSSGSHLASVRFWRQGKSSWRAFHLWCAAQHGITIIPMFTRSRWTKLNGDVARHYWKRHSYHVHIFRD